ncbi:hypothetical protein GDO78_019316 [Eleutherodactylus coqui]|uniref:Uncharacterized protein n=1 Tax=Eleutherodactylus coqui TaxID=57060 RepID=A0A8J6B7Y5_ELECQ|nr:hypothetical protein GDO78_019316 [Eleutherodactylus coqui]
MTRKKGIFGKKFTPFSRRHPDGRHGVYQINSLGRDHCLQDLSPEREIGGEVRIQPVVFCEGVQVGPCGCLTNLVWRCHSPLCPGAGYCPG